MGRICLWDNRVGNISFKKKGGNVEKREKEELRGVPSCSNGHSTDLGVLTWKKFNSIATEIHSTSGRNTEAEWRELLQ